MNETHGPENNLQSGHRIPDRRGFFSFYRCRTKEHFRHEALFQSVRHEALLDSNRA